MNLAKGKKILDSILLIMVVLFLISGFGMTNGAFRDAIGLAKNAAFNMHSMLTWPFIIVLILHIGYFRIISFLRK